MKENSSKTAILGIGWLDRQACGCVNLRRRAVYGGPASIPPPWQDTALLGGPLKNMGRMDERSQLTCCACALALRDAGVTPKECRTMNVGIAGANDDGSLRANQAYFADYLRGGRRLGRGNLFVYTLPTSPLAEASIHFGLKACLLYSVVPSGLLRDLLRTAEMLITGGQADYMLACCNFSGNDAVAFLLGPERTAGGRLCVDDVAAATAEVHGAAELAVKIEDLQR